MRYFSFSPEHGFGFHNTRGEAKQFAEHAINEELELSVGEDLSDDIERACWG